MLIYPLTVKFQNLQPPFLATFKDFFYNVPIACFPIACLCFSNPQRNSNRSCNSVAEVNLLLLGLFYYKREETASSLS